jgi:hypothetical protein
MPEKKTLYQVGDEQYEIPKSETKGFLSEFPDAQEVIPFKVGEDTYEIPSSEVESFQKDFPDAAPVKKKGGFMGFLGQGAFWGQAAQKVTGAFSQPSTEPSKLASESPVESLSPQSDTIPPLDGEADLSKLSLFNAEDSAFEQVMPTEEQRENMAKVVSEYVRQNDIPGLVQQDINNYYSKQGWQTPEQKFNEYNAGVQEISNLYEAGELEAEEAEAARQGLLDELNLISKGGRVTVPSTELDMFKDIYEDRWMERTRASKEKTQDGFLKDVLDELSISADRALKAPWAVLAAAERTSNGVLSLWGLRDRQDDTYWQQQEQLQDGWINEMAALNDRYDQSITDAVLEGNMAQAAGQAVIKAFGAIPQMLPIILGNAAGVTKAGIAYMGADKSLNKYLRNAEDPEMAEGVRIMNALSHGIAESAFLNIGTVPILKSAQAAMSVGGKDAIRKEAATMLTPYFQREAARLYKGMGPAVREGVEEMATGLSEDIADWAAGEPVEIGSHLLDDFAVGMIVGKVMQSAAMINKKGGPREYAKAMRRAVPKDLTAESQAELYMTFIEGDLIRMDLETAPESLKGVLKENLQALEEKARDLLKDSADPRYAPLVARYKDLANAGDILKAEAAEKASEKPVEPLSPESEGKVPPEGKKPSTEAKQPEKAEYRPDELIEYIPTNELSGRKQIVEQAREFLETEAPGLLEQSDGSVRFKKEGVFTSNSIRSLLGENNTVLRSKEQIDKLKQQLSEASQKIDKEQAERADMAPPKEGEIRYGKKDYKNVEALKEDLRKVDNLDRLPQTADPAVMKAINELKQERGVLPKEAAPGTKTTKQTLKTELTQEQIDEIPQLRERASELKQQYEALDLTDARRAELSREYRDIKNEADRRERIIEKQKTETDATKKPSTTEVPVGDQAKARTEVREGDAKAPAEETADTQETGLIPAGTKMPPPPPPTGDGPKAVTEGPEGGRPKSPSAIEWTEKVHKERQAAIDKQKKRKRPNIIDKAGEAMFNIERFIQNTLRKMGTEEALRARNDIILRHGASGHAAMRVDRARSRIFGDFLLPGRTEVLNKRIQKLLGDSASHMRVLELEKTQDKRRERRDAFVVEMIEKKLSAKQKESKKIANIVEKMMAEETSSEEVFRRVNEVFPNRITKKELKDIRDQALKKYPEIKHEGGATKETALDFLQKVENKDESLLAKYKLKPDDVDVKLLRERYEEYTKVFKDNLARLRDSGVISEALYDQLLTEYPYYSPRMYMEYVNMMDSEGGISGLKEIKGGSEGAMITNLDALLTDAIVRTESMAFNNRMLNSLAKVAKADPENGLVMIPNLKKGRSEQLELPTAETGLAIDNPSLREHMKRNLDEVYEAPPQHMVPLDYFENGVKKRLWMDKYVHETLHPGDKVAYLTKAMQIAGWGLGTPILRAAATGYNPEFAVKNIVLDATHQYFSTTEWSMWMPKAIMQMKESMEAVMEDAVMRKGRYLDAMEEGMGMNFLSDQGRFTPGQLEKGYSNLHAGVKEAGDVMGYIGNSSEVLMRLAIRERAIRNRTNEFIKNNGRSPNKAELKEIQRESTAVARSYVDFNQGGYTAKALNHLIPYLNAGLQVGRVAARAIARDPVKWAGKVSQIAALSYAVAAWNMGDYEGGDEEEKEKMRNAYLNDISPQIRGSNMVIMTPAKYQDTRGHERYLYIKIPVQPFVHNIRLFAEDMTIKHSFGGQYKDYKLMNNAQWEAMGSTFRHFGDLSSSPPLIRARRGYKQNYDDFYESPIWAYPEHGRDKSEEYYENYTPERFVAIGKASAKVAGNEWGLSPARLHYATKQIFTGSNLFASAMGSGLDQLALKIDPELKARQHKEMAQTLTNTPFVRRFTASTNPNAKDDSKEIIGRINKMKTVHNRHLREIMDSDLSDSEKDEAVHGLLELILEEPNHGEAKRVYNYYHHMLTGQDLSGNIYSSLMPIEAVAARAEVYHEKTKVLPPEQRQHADEVSEEIIGLWTDAFIRRLYELREKDGIDQSQEND